MAKKGSGSPPKVGTLNPRWAQIKEGWLDQVRLLDRELFAQIHDGHAKADSGIADVRFALSKVEDSIRSLP